MKAIKILSLGIVLFTILMASGCKKDEPVTANGQIKGSAISNGKTLKPTTFYLKFGTVNFPGTDISKYDKYNVADADGKFSFKGLSNGDYYIYAIGVDNGVNVSGSIHILLVNDEIKDNVIITLVP